MDYPQEKVKPYGQEGRKAEQVERMFDHIAPAYDRLNHLMSLGIDRLWRRRAIRWLRPFRPALVLDVATGTGDFAIQACRMLPSASLTGVDLSEGMMQVGRRKVEQAGLAARIDFQREDCEALTFADGVNFTAGLSVVRTSPAHGVGFDIAGKMVADPSPMRAAIYQAIDIYRNRQVFDEASANPLQHFSKGERNDRGDGAGRGAGRRGADRDADVADLLKDTPDAAPATDSAPAEAPAAAE